MKKKLFKVTITKTATVPAFSKKEATSYSKLALLDYYGWDTEVVEAEEIKDGSN